MTCRLAWASPTAPAQLNGNLGPFAQTFSPAAMNVEISSDLDAASRAAAQRTQSFIRTSLKEQDEFALALAGGSTPRRLYELLSEASLQWDRVHLYWGDERFVPHDHPKSNVLLVRKTLLDVIDIPETNVHPIPTSGTPRNAADTYADTLHRAFSNRRHTFDLVLLGMGEDGHTASLFPEHDPSPTDPKWVRAVSAPPRHDVTQRITCTLPVINRSHRAFILVAGSSKRETVRDALDGDSSLPISRVRPRKQGTWFLDAAATPASLNTESPQDQDEPKR